MDDPTLSPDARPYFIAPSVNFNALPQEMRQALAAIIKPAYDELVLGAADALARSAGASLCFLLSLEVLEQLELGRQLDFTSGGAGETDVAKRDRDIARYLRMVGAKQHCANFLLRLETVRGRRELPPSAE